MSDSKSDMPSSGIKLAHSDERRELWEFPCAKRIVAKQDCTIGGHFHRNKTEVFVLLQGKAFMRSGPHGRWHPFWRSYERTVLPGEYHEFQLKQGSILLCLATAPYDPEDEHQP